MTCASSSPTTIPSCARALALSVKTVETYKARVSEKLELRSRVDMVRYAARQGWLGSTNDASTE